jgi:hypothetical protein
MHSQLFESVECVLAPFVGDQGVSVTTDHIDFHSLSVTCDWQNMSIC